MTQRMPHTVAPRHRTPVFLALSLLSTMLAGCSRSDEQPPNVLLITLDTTRPDHMSCYGYGRETTPTIDALAAEGARFERAISTAGITPMSHSSILTGLNNYKHGMRVFYSPEVTHFLDPNVDTLAERLGKIGYTTGATVSSYPVSEVYGLHQGFDFYDTGLERKDKAPEGQEGHDAFWVDAETSRGQRRGDATVSAALDWLGKRSGEPWFLWVHMFDVHDYSLVPPAEHSERWGAVYDTKVNGGSIEAREVMYDPELNFMDLQIARLVERLKASGDWENTIIVLTADHGQGLKDGKERHGWVKHRLLYDWCIRVPLIMRIPGVTNGQVIDTQVRTIDVVPTLVDLLDEQVDMPLGDVEGLSVLPLLRGENETVPRIAYADALNHYDQHAPRRGLPRHSQGENLFAVTDGQWKLIYHELKPRNHELFNLERDPLELNNVAAEHPDVIERLAAFLTERGAMKYVTPDQMEANVDPAVLAELGYGGDSDDEEEEE